MPEAVNNHAGIELDVIDFSSFNRMDALPDAAEKLPEKLDFKIFIRQMVKRLIENDSFLSFSGQIAGVNRILNMKYSSATDIADVILKDVALTSKLMKLVNSSFYGQFSHKGIETISEAMIILGTQEIKIAAASLKIYEMMLDISNIAILKDKTLKSLQRSLMARQIAMEEGIRDAEAIQVSAMLYDFGEYLVALFFPEIYIKTELLSEEKEISREDASRQIIGISYSSLGRYIASKWKLPESITNAMKPVNDLDIPRQRLGRKTLQNYICSFTFDLCRIEFSMVGKGIGQQIIQVSEKYKTSLDISPSRSVELLKASWQKIQKHAAILNVDIQSLQKT